MRLYKFRRNIYKRLKLNMKYYKVLTLSIFRTPRDKVLEIDISDLHPNRYLYSFLKFFDLCGYTVFIPRKKDALRNILESTHRFSFMPNLLEEGFVKFGSPLVKNKLVITKEQLSNDYFSASKKEELSCSTYHVPICEFPFYYNILYSNKKYFHNSQRKNSVFMAGNIDVNYYNSIQGSPFFNILSRFEVSEFIKQQDYFVHFTNFGHLLHFINDSVDEKVVIINTTTDFRIENKQLKSICSSFRFYLALPGIDMPQAHNIIEAMSCGCIPIMHETYAGQFKPPLKNNFNAFVYGSLKELDTLIRKVFELNINESVRLKKNVISYYERELSPNAIVEKVEKGNFERIYILAEADSLFFLKSKMI